MLENPCRDFNYDPNRTYNLCLYTEWSTRKWGKIAPTTFKDMVSGRDDIEFIMSSIDSSCIELIETTDDDVVACWRVKESVMVDLLMKIQSYNRIEKYTQVIQIQLF